MMIFPPVKDAVLFQPGIYLSVHINLFSSYMSQVASKHPHLAEAWRKMKTGEMQAVQKLAIPITPHIRNLLDKILWCKLEPGKRDLYIQSKIGEIILLYIIEMESHDQKEKAQAGHYRQITVKAVFYIMENLDNPLTVAAIAKEAGVMIITLERAFKKMDFLYRM